MALRNWTISGITHNAPVDISVPATFTWSGISVSLPGITRTPQDISTNWQTEEGIGIELTAISRVYSDVLIDNYRYHVSGDNFTVVPLPVAGDITLSVNPSSVGSAATSTTLSITSNTGWTLSLPAGVTATTTAGTGNGNQTINIGANPNTSQRTLTITATTSNGVSKTVSITQDAKEVPANYAIFVDAPTWTDRDAGTITGLQVSSNTSWSITIDDNWLTASPSSSSGNENISLSKQANTSTASTRTTTVRLKIGNVQQDSFEITQQEARYLYMSKPSSPTSSGSGTITIVVYSNMTGWKLEGDADWITSSGGWPRYDDYRKSVYLTKAENNTGAERTVHLTLSLNGETWDTHTIVQSAGSTTPDFFDISASPTSIGSAATSVTLTISSNTSWSLSSNQSWATLSESTGTGNRTVTLTIDANSDTAGTRTVRISGTGGTDSDYVDITQSPAEVYAEITESSLSFTNAQGTDTIHISSNTNWTLATGASWLSLSSTAGTGDATITVTAATNTGDARNSTITLKTGSTTMDTCSVSQDAAAVNPIEAAFNSTFTSTSTTVNVTASSITIYIKPYGAWTVDSKPDWVTISPSAGTSNSTVQATLSYTTNDSKSSRSGNIVLKQTATNQTATLRITQNPLHVIHVQVRINTANQPAVWDWSGSTFRVRLNAHNEDSDFDVFSDITLPTSGNSPGQATGNSVTLYYLNTGDTIYADAILYAPYYNTTFNTLIGNFSGSGAISQLGGGGTMWKAAWGTSVADIFNTDDYGNRLGSIGTGSTATVTLTLTHSN